MLDKKRVSERALHSINLCKSLDFVEEPRKVTTPSSRCLQCYCGEIVEISVKVARILGPFCSFDSFRSNEVFFCTIPVKVGHSTRVCCGNVYQNGFTIRMKIRDSNVRLTRASAGVERLDGRNKSGGLAKLCKLQLHTIVRIATLTANYMQRITLEGYRAFAVCRIPLLLRKRQTQLIA